MTDSSSGAPRLGVRRGAGRAAAGRGELLRRRGTPFPKLILSPKGAFLPILA